jgi:hypothetical protein
LLRSSKTHQLQKKPLLRLLLRKLPQRTLLLKKLHLRKKPSK